MRKNTILSINSQARLFPARSISVNKPSCLRIPFMHTEFSSSAIPGAMHLWPFPDPSPDPVRFWPAQELPLDSAAISTFLAEISSADVHELERQRQILLNRPFPPASTQEKQELAALAAFSREDEFLAETRLDEPCSPIEAHLYLLKVWQLEEKVLELASLEEKCSCLDATLLDTLLEDTELWHSPAKRNIEPDLSPLPACFAIAEKILLFAPTDLPLLLEGHDLDKSAGMWRPASEILPELQHGIPGLLACRCSLNDLSGQSSRMHPNPFSKSERIWLILEDPKK